MSRGGLVFPWTNVFHLQQFSTLDRLFGKHCVTIATSENEVLSTRSRAFDGMPCLASVVLQKPQSFLTINWISYHTSCIVRREQNLRTISITHLHTRVRQFLSVLPHSCTVSLDFIPCSHQSQVRPGFRALAITSSSVTPDSSNPSTLPPRAAVFWDLDNKHPNDVAPREAANRLRQLAENFGRDVDILAYANRSVSIIVIHNLLLRWWS